MDEPLSPGATIGILGGGQLGRMLSVAAARLGLRCHVYDPAPDPPAGDVARAVTTAAWTDHASLTDFASGCDVVTFEFENIPLEAIDGLACPVRPGRRALQVSQDRLVEKAFLTELGLATAPYVAIDPATLPDALRRIGPGLLKTRRFGYDGKGQVSVQPGDDADAALSAIDGAPAILEGLVRFDREVSVIAARAADGTVVCFDPGENVHREGILRTTTVPAALSGAREDEARAIATRILEALDYVGVLAVELFETPDALIVNEIAPRVHNSGHWTLDGCLVDQFEQHVRAIAGWPLGDGSRHSDAIMSNLIGDELGTARDLAARPDTAVHLYGKTEVRAGRKMGHATRLTGPASR